MGCANSSIGVDLHDVYPDNCGHSTSDLSRKLDGRMDHAKPFAEGSMSEYKFIGKLGEGTYATVHKARCPTLGDTIVAVKIMDLNVEGVKDRDATRLCKRRISKMKHEVAILTQVAGMANVIDFYGSFVDGRLSCFVMEMCDRSLLQAIERLPAITEKTVSRILRGMFNGLSSVHQVGIVHRDVKPENFMCLGPKATVKLCDFGLASSMPRLDTGVTGVAGTAPFMSPEMLLGCSYSQKTDTWSMGVIVYSLFYGQYPYGPPRGTDDAIKVAIRSGSPMPGFKLPEQLASEPKVSLGAREFSMALLERDQTRRLSATSALFDGFLMTPGSTNLAPMLESAKTFGAFQGVACAEAPQKCEIDLRIEVLQQQVQTAESARKHQTLEIESGGPATREDDDDCSTRVASMIDSPVSSLQSWGKVASDTSPASP